MSRNYWQHPGAWPEISGPEADQAERDVERAVAWSMLREKDACRCGAPRGAHADITIQHTHCIGTLSNAGGCSATGCLRFAVAE